MLGLLETGPGICGQEIGTRAPRPSTYRFKTEIDYGL